MKLFKSLGLASLMALACTNASAAKVYDVSIDQVLSLLPQEEQVVFGYVLDPISNWSSKERKAMDLFSGFRAIETLNPLTAQEDLEMYRSKAAFLVNRNVDKINLENIDTLQFLQSFDVDLRHEAIHESMANLMYQNAIDERIRIRYLSIDNQVKKGTLSAADAEKAKTVLAEQAEVNAAQKWCGKGADCIKSSAPFPGDWQWILDSGKAVGQIDPDFPKEISFMSEVVRGTAEELADRAEVQALESQVSYPASYVLIESSFWFNRFMQSGKTVISLHKVSDSQTLVLISTAFAVEADALTKYDMFNFKIRDVFLGNSFVMNRDEGFAKGLPPYNKDLATSLKALLESR